MEVQEVGSLFRGHLRSSSAIGLKKYLDEKEIFRMDHYLAKTLVRPEGMDHYFAVVW